MSQGKLEVGIPDLKELHKVLLELMLEFERICFKNNINYSLAFGTLLGAVRHKGFIPWDDDVDIIMTRNNYEKFCNACVNELQQDFFLQTKATDCKYPYNIARLRKENTAMIYGCWKDAGFHQGIYLDIFPCDEIPDKPLSKKIQRFLIIFATAVRISRNKEIFLNKERGHLFLRRLTYLLLKLLPNNYLDKIEYEVITKYNNKGNARIGVICEGGVLINTPKVMVPFSTNIFMKYKKVSFAKHFFMAVDECESILSHWYGDYMKLPPENERLITHKSLIWDAYNSYKQYL